MAAALGGAVAFSSFGASGFFTPAGAGTGSASAGVLAAPAISGATPGAGTVALAWSTVVPPSGAEAVTYYVTRNGAATTGCPTQATPTTATTCTDTGLTAGSYSYKVVAVWHSWTAPSAAAGASVASGAATKLDFTVQPVGSTAGATMSTVKISVEDALGNVVTSDSSTKVTLALGANPAGGALAGAGQVTVSSGVATYAALSIDKAAYGYTLSATDTTGAVGSDSSAGAVSSAFTISPAAASQLVFSLGAGAATAGSAFGQQPVVVTQDSFGNDSTVGLGASRNVTVSIGTGSGTLRGTTTLDIGTAGGNGVVTFSGLSIDSVGTKTLKVTAATGSPSLTSATSPSFSVAQASPTLTLIGTGIPAAGTAGAAVAASSLSATVAGSSGSNAGGTITFVYFQQASAPVTCSSGGTAIGTATVAGNNTYTASSGFTPTVAGSYWLYASYGGDGNNNAAGSTCGAGMAQIVVTGPLVFSVCSLGTGGVSITCPTTGGATASLKRANQGGGSWTAKVTLTDGAGNPVVNTTTSAISITVTEVTPGATITYSSGTSLTIPVGSSQSSNSFTYNNAGVSNGRGSDTVSGSAIGYSSATAAVSW
jgi:hypothetical protein